ncbi:hypothetical protein K7G98_13930 [Saccharothrix sp. MB29]|nr:hypothetical protein [Saccharothrix sp. MB29]
MRLPDGAIKKSRDLSVELWFKTTSGGPLLGFQRAPFDRDPIGAVPVLCVDRDGKLRGQFWHGRVAPITSAGEVDDGDWHHVVLSGSLATQTLFLDGVKVGTTEGEIDDSLLNHGQIGASHVVGPADWAPHGWWPDQSVKHFAGQIDEVAIYQHPLGEEAARAHFRAREHADQLTKVTMPSGRVAAQLTHDTTNDRVSGYTDADGGRWTLGLPQVSGTEEQDAQGRTVRNLVRSIQVTDPGNRSHFFDYDPVRGRIIRFVAPLGTGVRLEDRPDPSVVPTTPSTAPPCTAAPTPNPDGSPSYCGGTGVSNPDWQGGPVQGVGVRTYDYDAAGSSRPSPTRTATRSSCATTSAATCCRARPAATRRCATPSTSRTTPRRARSTTPTRASISSSPPATAAQRPDRRPLPDHVGVRRPRRAGQADDARRHGRPAHLHRRHHRGRRRRQRARGPASRPPRTRAARSPPTGITPTATWLTTERGAPTPSLEGRVTKYRYDLLAARCPRPSSPTPTAGPETKYAYDELNRPVEVTDARSPTPSPASGTPSPPDHLQRRRPAGEGGGLRPVRRRLGAHHVVHLRRPGPGLRHRRRGREDQLRLRRLRQPHGSDANGTKVEYAYTARNKVAEWRLRGWHVSRCPVASAAARPVRRFAARAGG